MANNLFVGANGAVAKENISFDDAGVTEVNTRKITKIGNPNQSHIPGTSLNPINEFEVGNWGYYIEMLQDVDWSAFLVPPVPGSLSFDTDASAFFTRNTTAGGTITDPHKLATSNFITAAKANGYYSKLKCFYPYLGGVAAAQKLNLIANANNQVSAGGVTYSGAGVKGNGTDGTIGIGLTPNTDLTNHDNMFGCAILETAAEDSNDMGIYDGSTSILALAVKSATDDYSAGFSGLLANTVSGIESSAAGIWCVNRSSASDLKLFHGSTIVDSDTTTDTGTLPTHQFRILSRGNSADSPQLFSARTHKVDFIGSSFTTPQWNNFVTDLNTFLTAIGR